MTGASASGLSYTRLHRDETRSTNSEAVALARAGGAHGTVLSASRQTDGRGRRGRGWVSPAGNLYLSLLLRPSCALSAASQLAFVSALSVANALAPLLPADAAPQCKWPNDVLAGGGKIAGILLESAGPDAKGHVEWIVVGIGVNAEQAPDAPAEGGASLRPVSLAGLAGSSPKPAVLEDAILAQFAAHFDVWEADGFAPIRRGWLARTWPRGTAMEVRLPKRRLQGYFEDIDATGALVLSTNDGARRTIAAGDVQFPDEAA